MRIKVMFLPLEESILYIGQVKQNNGIWVNFSEVKRTMNTDLAVITDTLQYSYDLMKERLDAYENIAGGFDHIKEIEIKEEE